MNAEKIKVLNIGDRITFKSPTRDGNRKATRIVSGFRTRQDSLETWDDRTGVKVKSFNGWSDFLVMPHEILSVQPA